MFKKTKSEFEAAVRELGGRVHDFEKYGSITCGYAIVPEGTRALISAGLAGRGFRVVADYAPRTNYIEVDNIKKFAGVKDY